METILLLVHHLPCSNSSEEQLRSFNLLRSLREHYHVVLACFYRPLQESGEGCAAEQRCQDEAQKIERLRPYCHRIHALPMVDELSGWDVFKALLSARSLHALRYDSAHMHELVEASVEEFLISKAMVFSPLMAQYLEGLGQIKRKIVDFAHQPWQVGEGQAELAQCVPSFLLARERRKLLSLELKLYNEADSAIFKAPAELSGFIARHGVDGHKALSVENGVNISHFDPDLPFENPYLMLSIKPRFVLCFAGDIDQAIDHDALLWFITQVLPDLRRQVPSILFCVASASPSQELASISRKVPGLHIFSRVSDVRPYLKYCDLVVMPLRNCHGVQSRVLEAMAMGNRVIATSSALEGIRADAPELVSVDCAENMISAIEAAYHQGIEPSRILSGQWIRANYSWAGEMEKITGLLSEK